jgi:micrococcal nuclease
VSWLPRVTVERVIDGDTLQGELDLGWGVRIRETRGRPVRFRLLGMDAPERGQPGYAEAREALRLRLPVGTVAEVLSESLDSFGRTLCTLRLQDGETVP